MTTGDMDAASRLELGPIRTGDSETLFEWINDRDEVLWNAAYRPVHADSHAEWFAAVRNRADMALFAIRETTGGRLLGTCQLHSISPVHRSAELQIRIGDPAARGQGHGVAALRLLIAFGFRDLNLERIYLHVFDRNRRAIAAYERVGFQREGVARRAAFVDGAYHDVVLMGLLRDEHDAGGSAA